MGQEHGFCSKACTSCTPVGNGLWQCAKSLGGVLKRRLVDATLLRERDLIEAEGENQGVAA